MSQTSESTVSVLLRNIVAPVLVVVVSSLFAYQIAELNVGGARRQQAREYDIRRNEEARQKRADVYQRFLNAANRYAVAARSAIAQCPSKCTSPPDDYQNARYEFQASINEVYIYGSAEALKQSRGLAGTLPLAIGALSGEVTIEPVADADFRSAYQDFLTLICREAPATPRNEC